MDLALMTTLFHGLRIRDDLRDPRRLLSRGQSSRRLPCVIQKRGRAEDIRFGLGVLLHFLTVFEGPDIIPNRDVSEHHTETLTITADPGTVSVDIEASVLGEVRSDDGHGGPVDVEQVVNFSPLEVVEKEAANLCCCETVPNSVVSETWGTLRGETCTVVMSTGSCTTQRRIP